MSTSQSALRKRIKAHLYLDAVLPAFEDFIANSEIAKESLGESNFTLSFQTSSGLKSYLQFSNRSCSVTKTRSKGSDIILHFLTEEQLNNEFEKSGFRLPIPLRGASRITDIRTFKTISSQFEGSLRPSEEELKEPDFYSSHVALQLGIALRAAVTLTQHEPRAKRILSSISNGLAHFSIGAEGYGAWIEWDGVSLRSGKGKPEREPDVSVTFKDAKTALKAIGNRIDVLAAVGLQDIIIEGYAPLADAIGYIFERIPLYISP
ncbi:MAG: hypothetical protein VXU48_02475 [Verrucomicrobiota bacterium]|nr:hypothetical protein [Verrucomicrobiota bacterium]